MMEFQSPPTSLTDGEQYAYEAFRQRLDFVNDLADAGQFLKFHWMHTAVSPVPLEIKFHVLEEDPIKARSEFESRSTFLEDWHSSESGRTFKAYGHRHEATTQHFAELAFGSGTVKYVVVWIEKDPEPEPEPEVNRHFSVYGAKSNLRMYVKCDCGWTVSEPQDITAMRKLETAFGEHMRDEMIDAEVTE
jgi:hypothetical protein